MTKRAQFFLLLSTLLPALSGLSGCIVNTTSCSSGQTPCGGGCIDATSDPNNCGGCGFACANGDSCVSSVCVAPCPAPNVVCGASCVDLRTDPNNCGFCGTICSSHQTCESGICGVACAAGQQVCGTSCTDVSSDDNNCGVCGTVCPAGYSCMGSACVMGFSHMGGAGGNVPDSSTAVYRIKPGAATVVQPGQMAGFGITANTGGSYRFVWTGDGNASGQYREFWGSIYTAGNFSNIVPGCAGGICQLQSDDYLGQSQNVTGGERIDFDSNAASTLNGFDFVVNVEPVYFDLYIDGKQYPNLVFFPSTDTGQIANSAAMPFGLTTM